MDKKSFLPKGLEAVAHHLATLPANYHSFYLASLINEIGKRKNNMPTEKNEKALLEELNEALVQKIPQQTQEETLTLLQQSRSKRMIENTRFILENSKIEKNFSDLFHFSRD